MQVQPLPDGRHVVRQEHMWTLSSEHMSEPSIKSWMQFLSMANNAHIIDTTIRADSKEYAFQTDFLKYVKWIPVYRNDVTGELQDVAYEHLAKSAAYNAKKAKEAEQLRYALERITKCRLKDADMMVDIANNAIRDLGITVISSGSGYTSEPGKPLNKTE